MQTYLHAYDMRCEGVCWHAQDTWGDPMVEQQRAAAPSSDQAHRNGDCSRGQAAIGAAARLQHLLPVQADEQLSGVSI
jgi:hypothetical protein